MPANGWPPRWLSPLPTPLTSRGPEAIEFIESCCRVTKDSIGRHAGDLIRLRPWQKNVVKVLLATKPDGTLRYKTALVGVPRKNGKSSFSAGLALDALVSGGIGGEVYSIAGDCEQARIVFEMAKQMVAMDPGLSQIVTPYRDSLVVESTSSTYKVRSADAGLAQGLNPTFCVFDEVEVQPTRSLWDAMDLGRGARQESLLLGITTAGERTDARGNDTLAYSLYQYGKRVARGEVDDLGFCFIWYEPTTENADWKNPQTWKDANPGYDDIVSADDFEDKVKKTPEAVFRTYRLNQWVASYLSWLPGGAWDACEVKRDLTPGDVPCVFGFDGSRVNDSTALVMATVEETPHLKLLGLWERPPDDPHWRVHDDDVLPVIREMNALWKPEQIVCDIAYWYDQLEDLADEGLPIVHLPQGGTGKLNMVDNAQTMYEAVTQKHLTHDGDPKLARHFENVVLNSRGRIAKEGPMSGRKIDAATAAIMAHRVRASCSARPRASSSTA